MTTRNLHSLIETLAVRVVEEPGQPVHHTLCRVRGSEQTRRAVQLRKVVDRFLADRDTETLVTTTASCDERCCRPPDSARSRWTGSSAIRISSAHPGAAAMFWFRA